MEEYQTEAERLWGESSEFLESRTRTTRYTHADFAAAKVDQEAVTELFVTAYGNGYSVNSLDTRQAVAAHRAAISKWFYECSIEMQKNLALLYISDPRFKEYYESRVRGLAHYVHDAIMAQ